MTTTAARVKAALLAAFVSFAAAAADDLSVTGVVTFQRGGDGYFFLATPSDTVWRVQREANRPPVTRGDRVTVHGARVTGIPTPRLRADDVAVVGDGAADLPPPERVTLADLVADPLADAGAVDRYGRDVTVEGVVRDVNRRRTFMQLVVGAGEASVQCVVPFLLDRPTPPDLKLGAHVRVTGLYVYSNVQDAATGRWSMELPSVLTRTADDLVIVSRAPFWTPARFWLLIGGILVAAALLVFWVRSRERAQADAVRRERLRLSHDLHDGLQQLLAGTMFRLEAAMNFLPDGADAAREQMERACDSLYHTQTGLRAALWSMTEESEGPRNLSGLVRYAASRLAHWDGVVDISFRGEERHVSRAISGELLMVLQEAVGNALRHGGATKVRVKFAFRRDCLTVTVRDDGCGFDVAAVDDGAGHLGIRSMRERAARLGGTMRITSEIGHGVLISVKLPYGGAK